MAVPSVPPSAIAVIAGTAALAAAALGRLPHVVVGEHIVKRPIHY